MARNQAPSFQFYPDSWLSSTDIGLMTPAEEGAEVKPLLIFDSLVRVQPHTQKRVNLGTLGVREYLSGMKEEPDPEIEPPEFSAEFPTYGPKNRFGSILYIEKEGFLPLLEQAKFAERFDMGIMSSKGMGTTAVRTLIESVCRQVKILVLHDFDKSGFSIVGTLRRDTRRYEFAVAPQVVDLGLRLSDVEKWDLQARRSATVPIRAPT